MVYLLHLRNDVRQIVREPVMLILLLAPLLIIALFRALILFLVPFLEAKTGLDLLFWSPYILSFVLLMIPGLLGIVTGFMLIDDRDGNITELYSVTPMGRRMYLVNRFSLTAILSFVYTYIAYYVLQLFEVPFVTLFFLALLLSSESVIIALLLFKGADDKVKGLTYAKGLNFLSIFAFADLFSLKWFSVISYLFPSYWISFIIINSTMPLSYIASLVVHLLWLVPLVRMKK